MCKQPRKKAERKGAGNALFPLSSKLAIYYRYELNAMELRPGFEIHLHHHRF